MRNLIRIPMVHSEEETVDKLRTEREKLLVSNYWEVASSEIDGLNLNYRRLKVFSEIMIKGENNASLFLPHIPNTPLARILRRLSRQGARIIGVEDKKLVERSMEILYEIKHEDDLARISQLEQKFYKVMPRRDRAIAEGIDINLRSGETGLLFLGALHDIGRYIASDIRLETIPVLKDLADEVLRDSTVQGRGPERE